MSPGSCQRPSVGEVCESLEQAHYRSVRLLSQQYTVYINSDNTISSTIQMQVYLDDDQA